MITRPNFKGLQTPGLFLLYNNNSFQLDSRRIMRGLVGMRIILIYLFGGLSAVFSALMYSFEYKILSCKRSITKIKLSFADIGICSINSNSQGKMCFLFCLLYKLLCHASLCLAQILSHLLVLEQIREQRVLLFLSASLFPYPSIWKSSDSTVLKKNKLIFIFKHIDNEAFHFE